MNKLLTEYYAARKVHDEKLVQLNEKVEFIVSAILKAFKKKRRDVWWDYQYVEEEVPEIFPEIISQNEERFPIHISNFSPDYSSGFPIKFFDMTEEEIISHIQKEIEQEKLKAQQELEKRLKNKKKREEMKQAALNKLSKEDRIALGLK